MTRANGRARKLRGPRRTLSQFHGEKIHVLSFFHGVGIFLLTFCISMALGVIFGLACSLMLKHSELGAPAFCLEVGRRLMKEWYDREVHGDRKLSSFPHRLHVLLLLQRAHHVRFVPPPSPPPSRH
jgi:hypothetical protein